MTTICKPIIIIGLILASAAAFAAESYDASTRKAVQDVIGKQLDAFAHDDAEVAESFAAQGIREKFPEPAKFLTMVKANYAALIKPRSTHFDEFTSSPHGPVQRVTVVAADGTVWTAVYALEQADGTWRITGCGLRKESEQDI